MEEKINWYLFEAEDWIKDKKIRSEAYNDIRQFLLTIQKDSVKTREQLSKYYYYQGIDNPILGSLIKCGWLLLDALYDSGNEEWNQAKLILTDASIEQALQALKTPFNREWCFCLAIKTDPWESPLKNQLICFE